MTAPDEVLAHEHCYNHREEIMNGELCGCFHCLATFPPRLIERWVDERGGIGQTALCPECGKDTVIGSASGYPINERFLLRMRQHWFLK